MGLGMIMYFKSIKTFSIIFLVMCIINIIPLYVYTSNHKNAPLLDYKDYLFKTTIGNIGSSNYKKI